MPEVCWFCGGDAGSNPPAMVRIRHGRETTEVRVARCSACERAERLRERFALYGGGGGILVFFAAYAIAAALLPHSEFVPGDRSFQGANPLAFLLPILVSIVWVVGFRAATRTEHKPQRFYSSVMSHPAVVRVLDETSGTRQARSSGIWMVLAGVVITAISVIVLSVGGSMVGESTGLHYEWLGLVTGPVIGGMGLWVLRH